MADPGMDLFISQHLDWVVRYYTPIDQNWANANNNQGPRELCRFTWRHLDPWQREPYRSREAAGRVFGPRRSKKLPIPARGYSSPISGKPRRMQHLSLPVGHEFAQNTTKTGGPIIRTDSRDPQRHDRIHRYRTNPAFEDLLGFKDPDELDQLLVKENMDYMKHRNSIRGLTANWKADYRYVGALGHGGFGAVALWCENSPRARRDGNLDSVKRRNFFAVKHVTQASWDKPLFWSSEVRKLSVPYEWKNHTQVWRQQVSAPPGGPGDDSSSTSSGSSGDSPGSLDDGSEQGRTGRRSRSTFERPVLRGGRQPAQFFPSGVPSDSEDNNDDGDDDSSSESSDRTLLDEINDPLPVDHAYVPQPLGYRLHVNLQMYRIYMRTAKYGSIRDLLNYYHNDLYDILRDRRAGGFELRRVPQARAGDWECAPNPWRPLIDMSEFGPRHSRDRRPRKDRTSVKIPELFILYVWNCLAKVAWAMEYGHNDYGNNEPLPGTRQKIVHMDITPSNVLLDDPDLEHFPDYPRPLLGDWGSSIQTTGSRDLHNPLSYQTANTANDVYKPPEARAFRHGLIGLTPRSRFNPDDWKLGQKAHVYQIALVIRELLMNHHVEPRNTEYRDEYLHSRGEDDAINRIPGRDAGDDEQQTYLTYHGNKIFQRSNGRIPSVISYYRMDTRYFVLHCLRYNPRDRPHLADVVGWTQDALDSLNARIHGLSTDLQVYPNHFAHNRRFPIIGDRVFRGIERQPYPNLYHLAGQHRWGYYSNVQPAQPENRGPWSYFPERLYLPGSVFERIGPPLMFSDENNPPPENEPPGEDEWR